MKNINKIIRHKIIEITISLLIIVLSFPVWGIWNYEMIREVKAYQKSNLAYIKLNNHYNYEMYPVSDSTALKHLLNTSIEIKNDTIIESSYSLGMKVSKKSTIHYSLIKISFNNEVFYLKDFYSKEDNDYYYFIFDSGNINGKTLKYSFKIWQENNESYTKGTFIYDFVNLD